MPIELKFRLSHNIKTNRYEIEEKGITYSMTLEMTRHLKGAFANVSTVAEWYSDLDKFTRSEITRTGNIQKQKDDFFPDKIYGDE